jgi:hypothetical protein
VVARLDTGDPWIVERRFGKGRVMAIAGPLDAEGGTLPVNPDFVPLVNELVGYLADAGSRRVLPIGEPITWPVRDDPGADVTVTAPDGTTMPASVVKADDHFVVRLADTPGPGIYRLNLPRGPVHVAVAADPREDDVTALDPSEEAWLSEGWPLAFSRDGDPARLFAGPSGRNRESWRWLVMIALGTLCFEVLLTRRMARQGLSTPALASTA